MVDYVESLSRELGPLSVLAEALLILVRITIPIFEAKGFIFLQSSKIIITLLPRHSEHLIHLFSVGSHLGSFS